MLSLEQLATVIDCEGYVGINRMRHTQGHIQHSARIGLAMVHPVYPTALHERFGGSLTRQPNPKGNYTLWRWNFLGNKQVGPVLQQLLPHLIVKRQQAENILAFLSTFHRRHRSDPLSLEEKVERDSYWRRAKELNRPAPATTERDAPAMGCDSLNSRETVRGESEAALPPD